MSPEARRLGLGARLLSFSAKGVVCPSANRSNTPMRQLLEKAGWRYCGELDGLDEGDRDRVYTLR